MLTHPYSVNLKHVVHETVENETIVMNLINGYYYSFSGLASVIWEVVADSGRLDELIKILARFYHQTEEGVQAMVSQFVMELNENELIIERGDEACALNPSEVLPLLQALAPEFMKPVLFKYTDMQDVLLLDPIHDVDVKGWPEPKFDI